MKRPDLSIKDDQSAHHSPLTQGGERQERMRPDQRIKNAQSATLLKLEDPPTCPLNPDPEMASQERNGRLDLSLRRSRITPGLTRGSLQATS